MPIISYNSRMGLAKETVWGTAMTAPTVWCPFKTLKSEDDVKRVIDSGKRGNLTKDFASYAGIQSSKADLEADVYPDTFGNFLMGLFGQDNVTGASPYTHTFKLSANQPPSYTLFDYDGINERVYAGAMVQELGLKFTSEGDLSKSVKYMCKASAVGGSVHTPTFTTVSPFIGYQAAINIAGSANTRVIGGDINFKRALKFTYGANNSVNPTKLNAGTVEITGKFDFEVDDYTELNYYLNNTQPIVSVSFTSGTNVLTITMSKCDLEKIQGLDRSQDVVRVSANVRGLYNTTDGGPGAVTLVNTQSTAY